MTTTVPTMPTDLTDWRAWVAYGHAWAAHAGTPTARRCTRSQPAAPSAAEVSLSLHGYREETPGPRWQRLFRTTWPAYRSWYLGGDAADRPSLKEARAALAEHLPELLPTYERLVDLTGEDPVAARMLTMWRMPAFISGCTQAVLPGPEPVLVRNYDYDADLFEGVVASTNYSGRRQVLGTSDLLWGLLDGINEDGLAVSLTWGGRPGSAPGFGIPIVLRYLLETCATVPQAVAALRRIPVAQAYNLTLADSGGEHVSVFVAPDSAPEVSRLRAVANHRLDDVADSPTARAVRSGERRQAAQDALLDVSAARAGERASALGDAFLQAPLRNDDHSRGWGTLYTAVLEPAAGRVTYRWPGRTWVRHFADEAGEVAVTL